MHRGHLHPRCAAAQRSIHWADASRSCVSNGYMFCGQRPLLRLKPSRAAELPSDPADSTSSWGRPSLRWPESLFSETEVPGRFSEVPQMLVANQGPLHISRLPCSHAQHTCSQDYPTQRTCTPCAHVHLFAKYPAGCPLPSWVGFSLCGCLEYTAHTMSLAVDLFSVFQAPLLLPDSKNCLLTVLNLHPPPPSMSIHFSSFLCLQKTQ